MLVFLLLPSLFSRVATEGSIGFSVVRIPDVGHLLAAQHDRILSIDPTRPGLDQSLILEPRGGCRNIVSVWELRYGKEDHMRKRGTFCPVGEPEHSCIWIEDVLPHLWEGF